MMYTYTQIKGSNIKFPIIIIFQEIQFKKLNVRKLCCVDAANGVNVGHTLRVSIANNAHQYSINNFLNGVIYYRNESNSQCWRLKEFRLYMVQTIEVRPLILKRKLQ